MVKIVPKASGYWLCKNNPKILAPACQQLKLETLYYSATPLQTIYYFSSFGSIEDLDITENIRNGDFWVWKCADSSDVVHDLPAHLVHLHQELSSVFPFVERNHLRRRKSQSKPDHVDLAIMLPVTSENGPQEEENVPRWTNPRCCCSMFTSQINKTNLSDMTSHTTSDMTDMTSDMTWYNITCDR